MKNLNETNITEAVVASFDATPDPRLRTVMQSLARHLHDFAREVQLTEAEWMQGIEFLTATGKICTPIRQEFILLSDTFGLSQLVVAQNHSRPQEATEQTVVGPFHVADAPIRASHGEDISVGRYGEPCFVDVSVIGGGRSLPDVMVDVWQADGAGLYDVQDDAWTADEMSLRAVFRTDRHGRLSFRTVLPASYPIPTDGPVGAMLESTSRHPMRPAHIHFMVDAPGHDRVVTHVYVDGDPWLESDTVFGVRSSCVGSYVRHEGGRAPDGSHVEGPFHTLAYEFVLTAHGRDVSATFAGLESGSQP